MVYIHLHADFRSAPVNPIFISPSVLIVQALPLLFDRVYLLWIDISYFSAMGFCFTYLNITCQYLRTRRIHW